MGSWLSRIAWSEEGLRKRSLAQTTVTDIDFAMERAINRAEGYLDSGIPAVYRAEGMIAGMVGSLAMEQVQGKTVVQETRPILTQPNPAEEYTDSLGQITSSLIYRGNAYLHPTRFDELGFPKSCLVLHPDEVTCQWDPRSRGARLYRSYMWNGEPMDPDREIIHIRLNSWPGYAEGVGPITACRLFIEGELAKLGAAATLFEDGLVPTQVLTVKGEMTDDEAEAKKQRWIEARKASRVAVMTGEVGFEQVTLSAVDAQFIEFMEWGSSEIATLFGLDGFMLNASSGGSSLQYSTSETALRHFVTTTLSPIYLERIAGGFSRMLPTGRKARFITNELFKSDLKSMSESVTSLLVAGVITVNEARQMLDMSPISGGDQLVNEAQPQEMALV